MLRSICSVFTSRALPYLMKNEISIRGNLPSLVFKQAQSQFCSFPIKTPIAATSGVNSTIFSAPLIKSLLSPQSNLDSQVRTFIKFSARKGKRKTVRCILTNFKRLHWGIWIRPMSGRHKHLWYKSKSNRRRLRQHVFVNCTQTMMLDKMVSKFWRRPHYYVDDPYTPYHSRDEFRITRHRPWRPEGVDYEFPVLPKG